MRNIIHGPDDDGTYWMHTTQAILAEDDYDFGPGLPDDVCDVCGLKRREIFISALRSTPTMWPMP